MLAFLIIVVSLAYLIIQTMLASATNNVSEFAKAVRVPFVICSALAIWSIVASCAYTYPTPTTQILQIHKKDGATFFIVNGYITQLHGRESFVDTENTVVVVQSTEGGWKYGMYFPGGPYTIKFMDAKEALSLIK